MLKLRNRFAAFAALVALCGCFALLLVPLPIQAATSGSGRVAVEDRDLPAFQAITVEGHMHLSVRQGSVQSVRVQADDTLLPLLETRVEFTPSGSTLRVSWQRGARTDTRAPVRVTVVVPALSAVTLAGAGDARVESFETPALKLTLSGSGDAQLHSIETADLSIRLSGSGDVLASGTATKLAVSLAGSGDLRLSKLRADEVSLRIAGSGDADVHAEKTLDVSIAGSGDVVYSGAAAVKSRVAGSGSVTRR